MPQASSRTSRDSAQSSPKDCQSPLLTKVCTRRREGGEGGKEGPRGTPGTVVQAFQAAIFFRSGAAQRGIRDYDSQPPFRFVFVQKKKPHSPSSLFTHTLTHTHGRHARTRAPKGKPRLAFLPRRQSCLGLSAKRESGGRSRDL